MMSKNYTKEEQQNREPNKDRDLLQAVLDFRRGKGKYNFSQMPMGERPFASADAWNELEYEIETHLADATKKIEWKPKLDLLEFITDSHSLWSLSDHERWQDHKGTIAYRHLEFWWNVRQLVQDLNRGNPVAINPILFLTYDRHMEAWCRVGYWTPIGPFSTEDGRNEACDILNASEWSKGGVPCFALSKQAKVERYLRLM